MRLAIIAMLGQTVLGFPFNVSISSSVISGVNSTEQNRACWQDSDCVSYPFCRRQPSSCRCMRSGSCFLVRSFGQHCTSSSNCGHAMLCLDVASHHGETKIKGVCRCEPGARYSRFLNQCLRVNPSVAGEMPRFADLPDPGGEDADAPEEVPPTYDGAILLGVLSLGLVLLCLILTMWCHYTSSHLRKQLQSHECLYTQRRPQSHSPGNEKIPLDMFLPPPEMYQTPGFQNYSTINEGAATTSHAHESLGMLGTELTRTLR